MKTTNNAQKTGLRGLVIIAGVLFIAYTVGAQNFFGKVLISNSALELLAVENSSKQNPGSMHESHGSVSEAGFGSEFNFTGIGVGLQKQVLKYDANSFAESEFTNNSINSAEVVVESNLDAIELALDLQVEAYNPENFVEGDLLSELENVQENATDTNYDAIELALDLQVDSYNPEKYVEAELVLEKENFIESNQETNFDELESNLKFQVAAYDASAFVTAEMAAERIEAEKEFLERAAAETAMESDEQIEKYFMHFLAHSMNSAK